MRGSSLLAGQLAGIVVLGVLQAVVYIAVGLLVGVRFASGPGGHPRAARSSRRSSRSASARSASFLALRTGSGEAVQGFFPVFFVFLFISSMNTPRDLIEVDWFRDRSRRLNPVSYLIDCVRSLIITGWDAEALALGFGHRRRASRSSRSPLAVVGARRGGWTRT